MVEHVLGDRRLTEQRESAARPSPSPEPPDAPAGEPSQHELVREAVRYARELDTIAKIDHALVDIQRTIESAARSYDEDAYRDAYEKWQEVWARHTSPVSDPELLDRIQVVGSLLSEVVLSDRTPHQLRPWMVVARGHERPCRTRLHDAR